MSTVHSLGERGESLATDFLLRNGYRVVMRNYRSFGGEIDIIARQKDEFIFVEVKTRTSTRYGFPEESVTPLKLRCMTRAIQSFLRRFPVEPVYRIDIISVEVDMFCRVAHIRHIKNIEIA
jgi:putative endonuclease